MKLLLAIVLWSSLTVFGAETKDLIRFHLACDPKTQCLIIPTEGGKSIYLEKDAKVTFGPPDILTVDLNSSADGTTDWFTLKVSEKARVRYADLVKDNAGVNLGVMYDNQLISLFQIAAGPFDGTLTLQAPYLGPKSLRHAAWLMEKKKLTDENKMKVKRIQVLSYAVVTTLLLLCSLGWVYWRKGSYTNVNVAEV